MACDQIPGTARLLRLTDRGPLSARPRGVSVRPRTRPASTSVHGHGRSRPGLPAANIERTNSTTAATMRSELSLIHALVGRPNATRRPASSLPICLALLPSGNPVSHGEECRRRPSCRVVPPPGAGALHNLPASCCRPLYCHPLPVIPQLKPRGLRHSAGASAGQRTAGRGPQPAAPTAGPAARRGARPSGPGRAHDPDAAPGGA